jgi:hypothetical protein
VEKETAERIKDVLSVDPISEFEVRSGKSYKTNSEIENLAMMFSAMEHGALKAESLKNQCDTYHGMETEHYIAAITQFGFSQVLCEEFTSEKWGHRDKYFIFWHPKGLLLSFDTFMGRGVNGGKVYYNWVPAPDIENRHRYTSSGYYSRDGVWVGDHDCREGLIANMTAMESSGSFLSEWAECPRLWLLSYADHETCCSGPIQTWTSGEKTADRVSKLPEHVQSAIRGLPK